MSGLGYLGLKPWSGIAVSGFVPVSIAVAVARHLDFRTAGCFIYNKIFLVSLNHALVPLVVYFAAVLPASRTSRNFGRREISKWSGQGHPNAILRIRLQASILGHRTFKMSIENNGAPPTPD